MKLRKVLILSLIFIWVASTANAQFYFGVKGGYTGYKLTGQDVYGGMNNVFGPSGGAIVGFKIVTDFAIQTEILYQTKGVHQLFTRQQTIYGFQNDTTPVTILDQKKYDNTLKMTYAEIPVLFKKSFSFKGGIFPYDRFISHTDIDFFIGPYFAYRLGATTKLSTMWKQDVTKYGKTELGNEVKFDTNRFFMGQKYSVASTDTVTYPTALFAGLKPNPQLNASSGLNSIDAGIIAGLGISIEVSETSKLTFDARFSKGFLSIDKTYFNNIKNTFEWDPTGTVGNVQVASKWFVQKSASTKSDLKNSGFGVYVGYIYYIN